MSLLRSIQRSLLLSTLFLLAVSANAVPWQFDEPTNLPRNLVVREHGRLKLQNTDKGLIRYFYEGKQLKEIRGPGEQVAQYVYENNKLAKIVHSDGTVDVAVPVGKNLVRIVSRRQFTGPQHHLSSIQFNKISPTDPEGLVAIGGEACQIDLETGESIICSDWGGGGGGGGGHDGGGGDYGGGDYGDGDYRDGDHGGGDYGGGDTGGWEPNAPQNRAECYDRAYSAYDLMAKNVCNLAPTASGRAMCHATNSNLLAEAMTKCREDFPQ
jgi:hypothetical protein